MNRLSFSRQPTVWIGLVSAAVAFAAVFGLHMPQGFEAAAAGVITAAGAAVTWTQVRPAKHSVAEEDLSVRFGLGNRVASPGVFTYADPAEVAAKSAADLAKPAKKPVKKAAKKKAGQ